ncbi:hypothetical protein NHX12_005915 [Muraenolepis orangiensis]|uniref:Spondin domain-containing protein n=1 Tax=Muraenolepis orangiensis TaxID=630683 RepID=A0A9Q0DTS7_9TELE|nr:hypothetical protein NHX12_005915 [Muraenolepis orangiensis]
MYGDSTERPLLDCCACGTAKYRVTFYGNWSEKIHPKDYPRRANHWSSIIGSSHSRNYVLWEYGGYASDGVKQVAELGSPVKMEEEIREKSHRRHPRKNTKLGGTYEVLRSQTHSVLTAPRKNTKLGGTYEVLRSQTHSVLTAPRKNTELGGTYEVLRSQTRSVLTAPRKNTKLGGTYEVLRSQTHSVLTAPRKNTKLGGTYEVLRSQTRSVLTAPRKNTKLGGTYEVLRSQTRSVLTAPRKNTKLGGTYEVLRSQTRSVLTAPRKNTKLGGTYEGDDVLTVIKMKAQWPAWQPLNVRAAPSAEFSVDRTRHLMSFLTMMGPSPDWNVGLSAEDLCTKECGWVQRVVQDMIPWDAGTDSGSPNKQTQNPEKIRPLTSLDHPQGPFYDPEGGAITPVARVVVERIARKVCCHLHSATCEKGKRMRQRMLKAQLDLSVPCPHTQDFEPCMGPGCSDENASTCVMSEWITWSPCSATCGVGARSRERYVKQFPEDGSACAVPTEETDSCVVNHECGPSSCLVTEWGEWDACSATCGLGMKRRERVVKMPPADGSVCGADVLETEKCMMPECHTIPCMLTPWSDWSECSVTCGKGLRRRQRTLKSPVELGECSEELEQVEKCMLPECRHMIRSRAVRLEPQFGGDPCPDTVQRRKCKHPGCKMRPWSSWTDCTKLCGGGIQERLMTAKRRFRSAQLPSCKDRKEIRACNVHPC